MAIRIRAAAVLALIFIFSAHAMAQTASHSAAGGYKKQIAALRAKDELEKKTDSLSPIPAAERAAFTHLNYYRPKKAFCKKAEFQRFDNAVRFKMKTTTTRLPEYSVYGQLTFRHHLRRHTLFVYQNIELVKKPGYAKHLFVPFNDLTNGTKTYGGGRFLDLEETGADYLTLDFNKAYNPYCAYNHKYSCPIPPAENSLKLRIKAGEKKWHD